PGGLERILVRALERSPDQRYGSAEEMRADLEALIRMERWEGDALALRRFMRELFAEKLRVQAADVHAAGASSLESLLLRAEARPALSWMAPRPGNVRTPSAGLTATSSLYD